MFLFCPFAFGHIHLRTSNFDKFSAFSEYGMTRTVEMSDRYVGEYDSELHSIVPSFAQRPLDVVEHGTAIVWMDSFQDRVAVRKALLRIEPQTKRR